MNTPTRLLRAAAADVIPARSPLTDRERERRETILRAGRTLMAEFGRHAIRLADFTGAIHIPPSSFRRHFADLDELLGTILRDHLMKIVSALGAVPRQTPDRARALRAAYLGATRSWAGAPTASHLLLIRDSHLLPPDELASIAAIRDNIAQIVGGEHPALTLALLDTPHIHPARMEAALRAVLDPEADQVAAPTRIAPFTPRPRPMQPDPAPPAPLDWSGPLPPARINGFHGAPSEAPRRASS